jgi:ArsR family transcriptional regulator
MKLIQIYRCLCDETRLRILNLLRDGELCVCHLQDSLDEPQVKVSKHLAYLRSNGLVSVRRSANWMIYRLPERPPRELSANLACLQDCARENPIFKADASRLRKLKATADGMPTGCCAPTESQSGRRSP